MKKFNLYCKSPKQANHKSIGANTVEEGITKALLEKYKPKVMYEKESLCRKNVQRRSN